MSIQLKIQPGITLEGTTIDVSGFTPFQGVKPDTNSLDSSISKILQSKNWKYKDSPFNKNIFMIANPVSNPKTNLSLNPIAVNHQTWDNLQSEFDSVFSADLSDTVTVETSVTWTKSATAGVSFTVGLEVGGLGAKASASTSYSLSVTVGEDKTESRSEAVGSSSGVSATIPANKAAIAALFLERGKLTVEFEFEYTWGGFVEVYTPDGVTHKFTQNNLNLYHPYTNDIATMVFDFDAEARSTVISVPNTNVETIQKVLNLEPYKGVRDIPDSLKNAVLTTENSLSEFTHNWDNLMLQIQELPPNP